MPTQKPASIVVALTSAVVYVDSDPVHIRTGTAWAADAPVVKKYPEMFSADPGEASGGETPVERKTRAPGEKSNVRR